MKKILAVISIIWFGVTCMVTPVWLKYAFLNMTGLIYRYDTTMDEGTAGIIGMILFISWVISVFVPDYFILKYLHYKYKVK